MNNNQADETQTKSGALPQRGSLLVLFAPGFFVLLWSTGFIGAKLGAPYAEPFTFLSIRFALVLMILGPVVLLTVRDQFSSRSFLHSMVTGVFIHAIYLGGVFYAIDNGMPAGISALIVALQPLITAVIAGVFLKEKLTGMQVFWLVAALAGVLLVVYPKLDNRFDSQGLDILNISIVVVSAIGISVGSVYQKYFVAGLGLRMATCGQYVGALLVLGTLSLLLEEREVEWSGEFIFALGWLVFVLSLGAVSLLMFMIRRQDVSRTASLFYLVPAAAAIIAYFLFGEELQFIQIAGMMLVMLAVAMASRV